LLNSMLLVQAIGGEKLDELIELQRDLPERFWASLKTPDGDDWYFASRENCLPDGISDVGMQQFYTTDVAGRAIG